MTAADVRVANEHAANAMVTIVGGGTSAIVIEANFFDNKYHHLRRRFQLQPDHRRFCCSIWWVGTISQFNVDFSPRVDTITVSP